MRYKRRIFTILLVVLALSACTKPTESPKTTDSSLFNIKYRIVDKSAEPEMHEAIWIEPNKDELKKNCDFVVRAVARNVVEHEVSYTYKGEQMADYYTVAALDIDEVIYPNNNEAPEKADVLYIFSSFFMVEGAVVLEPGKEYVLFLRDINSLEDNPTELQNIARYVIMYPFHLTIVENAETYDISGLIHTIYGVPEIEAENSYSWVSRNQLKEYVLIIFE